MLRNIKFLSQLIKLFGGADGLKLFFDLKTRKSSNVNVPGIKYPLFLRKGTSDLGAFTQVFVHKEYNINFLTPPKVIIDAGANVGFFAILMKNKYPSSTIICIEPDKDNFEVLVKNVSRYKDIYCENCGLWNKDVMLRVYDKFDMGKWGMVVEENNEGSTSAVTIDTLLQKYSIDTVDILKLDIETSEKIVFQDNYNKWLPKVKMIVVELHDEMEEGCSKPFFQAINATFKKYKYSFSGENTVILNQDLP